MKDKICQWLKKIYLVVRFLVIIYAFVYVASSMSKLKEEIIIVQRQNVETRDVQAKLYSDTRDTIDILRKQQNDYITAVATDISTLTNYIQTVENVSNDNDKVIAEYLVQSNMRPTYEYLQARTVYLVQEYPDTDQGSVGTGTIIRITNEETIILTNKHVCNWSENSTCYVLDNDNKYPISLVKAIEVDIDAQIVKTNIRVPNKQAIIGIKPVAHQDNVYVVGNNNGNFFMYSEGTVSGFERGTNNLIIGMPSGPGNSGSGVFTNDGYLTGLLFAAQVFSFGDDRLSLDTSHAICVNAWILRLFLADYL